MERRRNCFLIEDNSTAAMADVVERSMDKTTTAEADKIVARGKIEDRPKLLLVVVVDDNDILPLAVHIDMQAEEVEVTKY